MLVRPLQEADFAAGDAILRDVYIGEGFSDPAWADELTMKPKARAGTWLGALQDDGSLIGLALLVHSGSDAAVAAERNGSEIRLLAVAPSARGSGAGRAIMIEAQRIARGSGSVVMTFSTQASMTAAHQLYRSLDYERVRSADYEVGDRCFIVFRKTLTTTTQD